VIFFREPEAPVDIVEGGDGDRAEETWVIGRRSRSAELRAFTERRERGLRAATFEEWLRQRARAVLRLRHGRVIAVEAPAPERK